jgi:hypothetical protein
MVTSRTGTAKWKNLRRRLIATRDHSCHYCARTLDPKAPRGQVDAIELDHRLPVVLYPELAFDPDNLVLSCAACNRSKSDRDQPAPLTGRATLSAQAEACRRVYVHVSGSLRYDLEPEPCPFGRGSTSLSGPGSRRAANPATTLAPNRHDGSRLPAVVGTQPGGGLPARRRLSIDWQGCGL